MHLKSLDVRNFRALDEIHAEFDDSVNVIVGPNAIGKTTILEAIRLAKALLAPRTVNEATQVLIALRALVQHNPQNFLPNALARDLKKKIEIKCRYQLTETELIAAEAGIPRIATNLVQAGMGQQFVSPATFIEYLTSPEGASKLATANVDLRTSIATLKAADRICNIEVYIDSATGNFESRDALHAAIIRFLEQRLPPSQTTFTYFPADRALPLGEQPVQIGSADAQQQLESHNSQPQMKYLRLKNTIFNTVITSNDGRKDLNTEFEKIFSGILKGRQFMGVGVDNIGLLSINVKDTDANRIFDLDGMSSGEKALVLTFLLISRSVVDGGMVLLDEPELHLNPAVCKALLSFILTNYALPRNIQFIICSHSPEILGGVFERAECALYHLISEKNLSKIRPHDHDEASTALRALGASESDGLLYKAIIFVEGEDDAEILDAGFGDLLRRYKIKDLGGRGEIEKQIAKLQEAEKANKSISTNYFIFDRDRKETKFSNSKKVKILQWQYYCLENYLIDIDVLSDILKSPEIVTHSLQNNGEVINLLKELAMKQLDDRVAIDTYNKYGYENPGLRLSEIIGKNQEEKAGKLFSRLQLLQSQVSQLTENEWKQDFNKKCSVLKNELSQDWDYKWAQLCDGKRLFNDLQIAVSPKMSPRNFKKRVIQDMARSEKSDNWALVERQLKELIKE